MSKASWAPQAEALRILGDERNEAERTFIFRDEDHTLGNALRHVIMQDPATSFAGYSVPHPSEPYVNVRLQTNGPPASKVLDDGLSNLSDICDALSAQLNSQNATPHWPSKDPDDEA
ncbi:DNA-directed RNA polymerase [Pelagophyceae sp. CCMP2097]|nr:DNA-directed RNA polymerase [Pelagophyceae sp. CCMP2097]